MKSALTASSFRIPTIPKRASTSGYWPLMPQRAIPVGERVCSESGSFKKGTAYERQTSLNTAAVD